MLLPERPPEPKTLEEAKQQIAVLWDLIERLVQEQQQTITRQEEQIRELTTQLEDKRVSHSGNSSTPPSRDQDWQRQSRRQRRSRKNTGKPKGAQPGHEKHEREIYDAHLVDESYDYYPQGDCPECGSQAMHHHSDPHHRHQVFDIPEVRYTLTEHRLHHAHCQACHHHAIAQLPDSVPRGQMGHGLLGLIAHLSGQYHLSIREIQHYLQSHWQLPFSTGAISQAQGKLNPWLSPLYQQISDRVRQSDVAHADETRHWRAGEGRWLWTLCTTVGVVFMVHYSRGKQAAAALLGCFQGILVSDRHGGYNDYPETSRQLCWAHIVRNVTWIAERSGSSGKVGQRLLLIAHALLRIEHRRQERCLKRDDPWYQRRMKRLKTSWQKVLHKGVTEEGILKSVKNRCQRLQSDETKLWLFIERSEMDIPLTNNAAERALRPYVIWRKKNYASQSHQGDQFRPQILSVLQTAKRWRIDAYSLLREICRQGQQNRGEVTVKFPFDQQIERH